MRIRGGDQWNSQPPGRCGNYKLEQAQPWSGGGSWGPGVLRVYPSVGEARDGSRGPWGSGQRTEAAGALGGGDGAVAKYPLI